MSLCLNNFKILKTLVIWVSVFVLMTTLTCWSWGSWTPDHKLGFLVTALTLAKLYLNSKWYLSDILLLSYSYMSHNLVKYYIYLTYISLKDHQNQGHISVNWLLEKPENLHPSVIFIPGGYQIPPLGNRDKRIFDLCTLLWDGSPYMVG